MSQSILSQGSILCVHMWFIPQKNSTHWSWSQQRMHQENIVCVFLNVMPFFDVYFFINAIIWWLISLTWINDFFKVLDHTFSWLTSAILKKIGFEIHTFTPIFTFFICLFFTFFLLFIFCLLFTTLFETFFTRVYS